MVDRRERETKLVILGVPEETRRYRKVKESLEISENTRIRDYRRLGKYVSNTNRKRPILVEVELKTSSRISSPGYVVYKSSVSDRGQRGGSMVLVRRALHSAVLTVDTSATDQVWLRFSCLPGMLLGFVYVTPSDSPYARNINIFL
ncbi:hypothetical protein E2C01_011066 [Portunus trituberculatus]|uniref:Uncharacterized protein n=1 Tax=Portunus trituberculatus TaxID=210409 RepID=A0A5B7DAG2_PORTR|nr:hypothetical protein [Portunus trituberculatus]